MQADRIPAGVISVCLTLAENLLGDGIRVLSAQLAVLAPAAVVEPGRLLLRIDLLLAGDAMAYARDRFAPGLWNRLSAFLAMRQA